MKIDDGDQITVKILWSIEANAECDRLLKSKSFFISPSGSNVRSIKFECLQTMYDLTKDPDTNSKMVPKEEVERILSMDPNSINFDLLIEFFADTRIGKTNKIKKSKYNINDIVKLPANACRNESELETTIGRLIWNLFMIDRVGLSEYFPYLNYTMRKSEYMKFESAVTNLLRIEVIDTDKFTRYIEHRDWLGLQLHAVITVSFTEKTIKTPDNIKKLRSELFEKYKEELNNGDVTIANKVEQELIKNMVDYIKDDPGFDLYDSGARGDINNHLKNMFLMRGAVQNPNTGKFDIMQSSFNEGLKKEDFTPASNSVVLGAYPKACGRDVPHYNYNLIIHYIYK